MLSSNVKIYFENFPCHCFNATQEGWNFMSFLTEFKDLVLGPQHVVRTDWCDLFLDLNQQVITKHISWGDNGWNYSPWVFCGDELVIHWENFNVTSTHCAFIELLAAFEVIKWVTFFQGWNDPKDSGEILHIWLLILVDKLNLNDFFSISLQQFLGIGYGW